MSVMVQEELRQPTVQEELQKVSDYIIEHGWTQGGNGRLGTKVCIAVAMNDLIAQNRIRTWVEVVTEVNRRAVELGFGRLNKKCPCGCGMPFDANNTPVITFNDHPGRTEAEIHTFLSDKWETLKGE